MLTRLTIQNYALIREVSIDFGPGLNIITGETGAGKSILLGALGLIAGNRADTSVLSSSVEKCIVEGFFNVAFLNIRHFFDSNELDYDDTCIVRREILPNGKSRAFINDSPVSLPILRTLSDMLIDIHSQHQTLLLRSNDFQLQLVDSFADNRLELEKLYKQYSNWKKLTDELNQYIANRERSISEQDYIRFQFEELQKAMITVGEEEHAEQELAALAHSEELKAWFDNTLHIMTDDENSIMSKMSYIRQTSQKPASWHPQLTILLDQLNNISVEIKEWVRSVLQLSNTIEPNPERLRIIEERLNLLHTLMKKHKVDSTAQLITLQSEWETKLQAIESGEEQENLLRKVVQEQYAEMDKLCELISQKRIYAAALIQKNAIDLLSQLGLKDANMHVQIEPKSNITSQGRDMVRFLFSANQGMPLQDLGKIASGGEVSRLMLAFKAMLSDKINLPTILFDEIDTGVSGGMADKIGQLMKQMSNTRQLVVITHLPQMASKGEFHFKVIKESKNGSTQTYLLLLNHSQRIEEIARLLSGASITDAALKNAMEMLKS